jgi:hypothetical protein
MAQFALLDQGPPTLRTADPNPDKLDSYTSGTKLIQYHHLRYLCRPLNDYPPEVERAELTYCGEFNDSHTAFQLGVYCTSNTRLVYKRGVSCQFANYGHVEVLIRVRKLPLVCPYIYV